MYLFLILLFHLTIFTSSKLCIIKWTIDTSNFEIVGTVDAGGIKGKLISDEFQMQGQTFASFNGVYCNATEFKSSIATTSKINFIDSGIVANIPQFRFPRKIKSIIQTTNTGIPINVAEVNLIGGEVSLSSDETIPLKFRSGFNQYEFDVEKAIRVRTQRTEVEILPLVGSRYDGNLNGQSTDETNVLAFVDIRDDGSGEMKLRILDFRLNIGSTIQLKGAATLKASALDTCTETCQLHGACYAKNSTCTCECGWSGNNCEIPPSIEYRSVDYVLPNRIPIAGGSVITTMFTPGENENHTDGFTKLSRTTFENDDMSGWNCGAITECGSFGKICGGFNKKGKNAHIEKKFNGLTVGETYTLELDFIQIDSWDQEWAHVLLDGVECWKKNLGFDGSNQCGNGNANWGDSVHKVQCTFKATKIDVDIRIWADLNEGLSNEAFAIDNVKFNSQTEIQKAIESIMGVIIVGNDVCNSKTVISSSALECIAPKASLNKPNYVAKVYRAATAETYCHLPHLHENDQNDISKLFYYDSDEVENICGTCSNGDAPTFSSTTESVVADNNLNELAKRCFSEHCREDNIDTSIKRDLKTMCTCKCLPGWTGYDCGKCMRRESNNTSNASTSSSSIATFGCGNIDTSQRGNSNSSSTNSGKDLTYVCDTNIVYEPDLDVTYYCNPHPELKELTGHFDVKMSCGVSGVGECSMNVWVPTPRGAFRYLGCQVYGCGVQSVTSTSSSDKLTQTVTCQKAQCSCSKDAPCTPYVKDILQSVTGPFDFICSAPKSTMSNNEVANCEVNEDHLPLKILLDCNAGVCRDEILQYQTPVPRRVLNIQLVLTIVLIALFSWVAFLMFFSRVKNMVIKKCKSKSIVPKVDNGDDDSNNPFGTFSTTAIAPVQDESANVIDVLATTTTATTNTITASNTKVELEERKKTLSDDQENFELPNDNNNNNSEVVRHNIRPVLSNILTLQQPIENAIETSNAAAIVNKQNNMYFHEVSYTVNKTLHGSKKQFEILKGVSGCIQCGKLTGMLGVSGAGKTSLLRILGAAGGRSSLPQGAIGNFIGFPIKCLFVSQESIIMDSLTVEEQIHFSAMLRQPNYVPYKKKLETIDLVIEQLNLTHVKKSYGKVLSGGEKRRLAIGLELVAVDINTIVNNYGDSDDGSNNNDNNNNNRLFLLDEPLSGLDSIIALHLVKCLSNIAKRFKLSIVMSVHQPSNEMYDLLDDVMFIDSGKMAYHGPAKNALVLIPDGILSDDYPAGRCPADVLLQNGKRIFNKNEDDGIFIKNHEWLTASSITPGIKNGRKVSAKIFKQLWYLAWRSTLNISRNPELLQYHLTIALCSALFLGTVFFNVTDDLAGFQNRAGAIFFVLLCFSFSSLSAIEVFIKDRKILTQELKNHYYVRGAYFIVQILSDIVLLRLMPTLLFALVFVAMMGLRSQATHMLIFTYILILVNCICGCFSMILAIIHSNVAAATITSNLFILISCLFGGLVVNTAATPTFLAWMRSISYFYYSFQGLLANEVNGMDLRFNPGGGSGGIKVKGETYMEVLGLKPNLMHDVEMLTWMCGCVILFTALTLYLFVPVNSIHNAYRFALNKIRYN